MRLWHKELIPVLPKQQLVAQWRECCCIARNISVNGTPNHLLVNKIMDYPITHFIYYSRLVEVGMVKHGYSVNSEKFNKWFRDSSGELPYPYPEHFNLFKEWHNGRYLIQCYFNLQEKHDCGGIPDSEWEVLHKFVSAKQFIEF